MPMFVRSIRLMTYSKNRNGRSRNDTLRKTAASLGLHWVFLLTAIVMAANLLWVYYRVPEYRQPAKASGT